MKNQPQNPGPIHPAPHPPPGPTRLCESANTAGIGLLTGVSGVSLRGVCESHGLTEYQSLLAATTIGDGFAGLCESFLEHATASAGRAEQAALKSVVGRITRSLGDLETEEINPLLIRAYTTARIDDGLAPRTVTNHLKVLRRVFVHGQRLGVIANNPAEGVRLHLGATPPARMTNSPSPGAATKSPSPTIDPKTPRQAHAPVAAGPKPAPAQPKRPKPSPTSEPGGGGAQPKVEPPPAQWSFVRIGNAWGNS